MGIPGDAAHPPESDRIRTGAPLIDCVYLCRFGAAVSILRAVPASMRHIRTASIVLSRALSFERREPMGRMQKDPSASTCGADIPSDDESQDSHTSVGVCMIFQATVFGD